MSDERDQPSAAPPAVESKAAAEAKKRAAKTQTPKKAKDATKTNGASRRKPLKTGAAAAVKFPRHTVEQALRIPRAILDQNAGKPCTPREAAAFLGMKVSGAFNVEVASASKFGFLDRPAKEKIRPTDLAKLILRPQQDGDETRGYRRAVMQAPILSDVYNHYRGENLPDERFLANALGDKFGISPSDLGEFRDVLLASLKQASLVEEHGDKLRVVDVTSEPSSTAGSGSPALEKLSREVRLGTGDSCFVVMPFAEPHGGYYSKVYVPAIEKAGLKPVRADASIFGAGKIIDQIWAGINSARVLVAELTTKNPNVFYELGLAHALKKPVVLVSSNEEDVPFDLKHIRVIYYDMSDPFWGTKLIEKVAENVLSAIKHPEEAIFRAVP